MINRVTLVGNLGSDPELRYTGSGMAVTRLSVATSEKWKDKSGEIQERTEWHRVVVWDKQAEFCNEYLSKGSRVYVEGRIQYSEYTTDDGQKRTSTDINAREVKFLSEKRE